MDQEKKVIYTVIILIIILVAGLIGMWYFQKNRYSDIFFEYNGFPIHKVQQQNSEVYQIEVESLDGKRYLITSRSNPKDLEEIPLSKEVLDKSFSKKEIFITMDSNATSISVLAATEISKIIGNPTILSNPIPTYGALIEPVEGKNVTVKNCEDADQKTTVIWLTIGSKNKWYTQGECVIGEAKSEYALIKLANRLTLSLIGVMEI